MYLLRHAEVVYFADPALHMDHVELTARGAEQARAAGRALACVRPDRVITSGLPRTNETARLVLEQLHKPPGDIEQRPELAEMRAGELRKIPDAEIEESFLGLFAGIPSADASYLGGEPVSDFVQRIGAGLDRLYAEEWATTLVILHGGVNRAVLSRCLSGPGAFFGHLEQSFACINIIDGDPGDFVVRAVNLTPYDPVALETRKTAIEQVLDDYRASRASA